MKILGIAAQNIAGLMLLASVVSFAVGVATPNYTGLDRRVWDAPHTEEHLQIIGAHRGAWRWARAWTTTAAILQLLGIGILAVLLRAEGSPLLSQAALVMFLLGTVFWVVYMAFQIAVEPLAADALAETSVFPSWFEPLEAWGITIGLFYMVLGFIGTALLGWALLQTAMLPGWLGWFAVVLGVAGGVSSITNTPRVPGTDFSVAFIPAWLYIVPLLLGFALLLTRLDP